MLAIAALVTAALFSGAAVYVWFAEHPARAHLDPPAQLTQWKPAYARGTIMQAGLAALSAALGIAVWLRWGDPRFLAGGVVMLGVIAWTFAAIWGLNNRLKATAPDSADTGTVAMLERWRALHGIRTLIGLAAMLIYAWALDR